MVEEKRITQLLADVRRGRDGAMDDLMNIVYVDLRRIAERQVSRQNALRSSKITLQPAELVNEAFLKLIKQRNDYDSRGHFFAIASRTMLRVLLDHHREKTRQKRGGNRFRVSLSQIEDRLATEPDVEIPAFVEAMEKLESLAPRTADVAKLRLLWGLTSLEAARALGVSVSTIEREWRFVRRWLAAELSLAQAGNEAETV
jgi:RNA polymerase sigma factor (TIGR02999 family)